MAVAVGKSQEKIRVLEPQQALWVQGPAPLGKRPHLLLC